MLVKGATDWWHSANAAFRAVGLIASKVTKCRYGEVLTFPDSSSNLWIPYTTGDSLPDCALPVSQMEDPSILLDIALLICKGQHWKYMDPTVTSRNSHILCIMVSWVPRLSIFFVVLTYKVQVPWDYYWMILLLLLLNIALYIWCLLPIQNTLCWTKTKRWYVIKNHKIIKRDF